MNLYFDARRGTYRYRRPTDGKWFQFGNDRARAIDAAAQLNITFLRGGDLVAEVLGETTVTLGEFLSTYERDVLPPRELAEATLDLYAVRFKQIRAELAERPIDQITIRMVAEFLETPHATCKEPSTRDTDRCAQPRSSKGPVSGQSCLQHNPEAGKEAAQAAHSGRLESHTGKIAALAQERSRFSAHHCAAPQRHSRYEVRGCARRSPVCCAEQNGEDVRRRMAKTESYRTPRRGDHQMQR